MPMQGPPPGMNPTDWVLEPLFGVAPGDPGYEAAQAEYQDRLNFLNGQPPVQPPVQPPGQPPGNPNPPVGPQPPGQPPGPVVPPGPGGNPTGPGGTNPTYPPTNPTYPPGNPTGPSPKPNPTTPTPNPRPPNSPYIDPGPVITPRQPEQPPSNPVTPPGVGGIGPALPGMLNQFNPRLHIVQGIDAGPVWTPEKTQQGVNQIRNAPQSLARNIPGLPTHAQQPAQNHLGNVARQAQDVGSLNFSRQASQANAQQQLQSERARAFAGGLPWLNLTLSDMQSDLTNRMRQGGAIANLLTGMV